MYKYANKHIELLKKIPFKEFSSNSDFIARLINHPEKYGTYEHILKCYYFISEEMWNPYRNHILIQFDAKASFFRYYDFVKKKTESLNIKRYKKTKLLNNVLDKNGNSRHSQKYHGLIFKNKPNIPKNDIKRLREEFLKYSYVYDKDFYFYKRNKMEIPEDWIEHLYMLLNELCEKAEVFYKHRGAVLLAEEAVNILSNQSIILYSSNLIKCGHNRRKLIRQIKERKHIMFGELQRHL